MAGPLLEAIEVKKYFSIGSGMFGKPTVMFGRWTVFHLTLKKQRLSVWWVKVGVAKAPWVVFC